MTNLLWEEISGAEDLPAAAGEPIDQIEETHWDGLDAWLPEWEGSQQ